MKPQTKDNKTTKHQRQVEMKKKERKKEPK